MAETDPGTTTEVGTGTLESGNNAINKKPANLAEALVTFEKLFQLMEEGKIDHKNFDEIAIPQLKGHEVLDLLKQNSSAPSAANTYLILKISPNTNKDLLVAWQFSQTFDSKSIITILEENLDNPNPTQEQLQTAKKASLALYIVDSSSQTDQKICEAVRRATYYNRGAFGGIAGFIGAKTADQTNAEKLIEELSSFLATASPASAETLREFYRKNYEIKSYSEILATSEVANARERDEAVRKIKGQTAFGTLTAFARLDFDLDNRLFGAGIKFLAKSYNTGDREIRAKVKKAWQDLFKKIKNPTALFNSAQAVKVLNNREMQSDFHAATKDLLTNGQFLWNCFKMFMQLPPKENPIFEEVLDQAPLQHQAAFIEAFLNDEKTLFASASVRKMPEKTQEGVKSSLFSHFDPLVKDDKYFKRIKTLVALKDSDKIIKRAVLEHSDLEAKQNELKAACLEILVLMAIPNDQIDKFIDDLSKDIAEEIAKTHAKIDKERQDAADRAEAVRKAVEEAEAKKAASEKRRAEREIAAARSKPVEHFQATARANIEKSVLPPNIGEGVKALPAVSTVQDGLIAEIVSDKLLQDTAFDGEGSKTVELEAGSPLKLLGAQAIKVTRRSDGGFDLALIVKPKTNE